MRINQKNLPLVLLVILLALGIIGAVWVSAQDTPAAPDATETEDDGNEFESPGSPADTALTQDDAIAIAESHSGSAAAFVELENEGGILVYSIELEDGSEVEVDANTGDILEVEGPGSDDD
jgi:uncharacterized membrane protein YkoI